MKKYIINKYTLTLLGIILFFLLWEILSLIYGHGSRIFPSPINTFKLTFSLLGQKSTYLHLGYSLLKMILGFLLGLFFGLFLGILVGNFKKLNYVFKPTITALKAIPTALFVFLFLVLFGVKNTPIIVTSLITFPIIFESTIGGYYQIDKEIIDTLKLENGNALYKNFKIKLPLAFPSILIGIFSSFALSFKIEIMAEIISGDTTYGLGVIIKYYQSIDQSDLTMVFAYGLIAIICVLIISLIINLVKDKLKFIYQK